MDGLDLAEFTPLNDGCGHHLGVVLARAVRAPIQRKWTVPPAGLPPWTVLTVMRHAHAHATHAQGCPGDINKWGIQRQSTPHTVDFGPDSAYMQS